MELHSRSSSISSTGTIESLRRKPYYIKQRLLHKFTSNWEYILITLGCMHTVQNCFTFVVIDSSNEEPTIIHYIICYLTVGLPLAYMQTLIGQYSQLGVILFKHMCPIGHGVGYAMLFVSFAWCCNFGMLMADILMYLLATIDTKLNWMSCPPNTQHRCWDSNSNCTQDCISEEIQMSAYVYWRERFMNKVDLDPGRPMLGKPSVERFVPLFITWTFICAFVTMGIDKYMKIIRMNIYISSTLGAILIFVCFLTAGSGQGMALMFRFNPISLLSLAAWGCAIRNVLQILALSRICHILYGTYMTPSMSSDILTISSVLLSFFATLVGGLLTHGSMGITMAVAGVKSDQLKYIWRNGSAVYFTVITQGIGFMGVPQLWSLIYFLTCICVLVNNLITQVDGIERTIADAHSSMRVYRNYMLVAICILAAFLGFMFSSKEALVVSNNVYNHVLVQVQCLDAAIMCLLICWVYRVQRLSDDIHFMQGSQPTKFWKIFWYTLPTVLGATFIYFTLFHRASAGFGLINSAWVVILVSPIPVVMVYEIFRFLKVHNLVGLVQPEERWGPLDPEERYLRHLFNPRQEIRSRRRDDTCKHNCLLNSKTLKKAIGGEKELRESFKVEELLQGTSAERSVHSASSDSLISIEQL